MAGAMQRVLDATLQYANDRVQFGRPIGKFQAIQHQLSVMAEHAFAGAHGRANGLRRRRHRGRSLLRAAAAKARASEAAELVAAIAHAVHGAIGVTEEFDLQLFTRRLHEWRSRLGSESYWNARSARALLAAPRHVDTDLHAGASACPAIRPEYSLKTMSHFLVYEQSGDVVTLTMNAPEARNALTGNTAVDEFVAAVERINADPSVRVVILTGAGTVFSSGGNVKDMKRFTGDEVSPAAIARGVPQRHPAAAAGACRSWRCRASPPSTAPAIGAGCDLACMCDIRIAVRAPPASPRASSASASIPGDGGAWLLPRVVGMAKAIEMSFTGDAVKARRGAGHAAWCRAWCRPRR